MSPVSGGRHRQKEPEKVLQESVALGGRAGVSGRGEGRDESNGAFGGGRTPLEGEDGSQSFTECGEEERRRRRLGAEGGQLLELAVVGSVGGASVVQDLSDFEH